MEQIQKQLFFNEEVCVYWHVGVIDVCGINGAADAECETRVTES